VKAVGHWERDDLSLWVFFLLSLNFLWDFPIDPLMSPSLVQELHTLRVPDDSIQFQRLVLDWYEKMMKKRQSGRISQNLAT
jgi:hypothetical protein